LTRVLLEAKTNPSAVTDHELDLAVNIMFDRLDKLRVKDASLAREGKRIVVILSTGRVGDALPVLTRPGRLELFDLQANLTGPSLDAQGFPRPSSSRPREREKTVVVTCTKDARHCPGVNAEPSQTYYYLFKYDPDNKRNPVPEMTGADFDPTGTRQDFDPSPGGGGGPIVLMQFTKEGGDKFHEITRELARRGRGLHNRIGGTDEQAFQQFAIVLDREIRSAPTIDYNENPDGIPGDNGAQITGIGSIGEAKDLALVLQTGALPLEFRVVSTESRTPS